ncbi:hypothetical protein [Thermococcus sp.]|uniref:hypothetical protein n=1 Tax=Thermococcus sp. TaxID=35749 RepID=UPI00261F068B|nr:hypothetical protein [Thermococcus sp.]
MKTPNDRNVVRLAFLLGFLLSVAGLLKANLLWILLGGVIMASAFLYPLYAFLVRLAG